MTVVYAVQQKKDRHPPSSSRGRKEGGSEPDWSRRLPTPDLRRERRRGRDGRSPAASLRRCGGVLLGLAVGIHRKHEAYPE